MDEKVLLTIAFLGALVGLGLLFFISEGLDYDERTIEQINAEKIKDMVKVKGEVASISNAGNATFIRVMQPGYIEVVVFENISLYEGEMVEVIGKIDEYEGENEIIAHRIRSIS
jgi:DNA/RNA endonuclease YhcR with UshA esterase domain